MLGVEVCIVVHEKNVVQMNIWVMQTGHAEGLCRGSYAERLCGRGEEGGHKKLLRVSVFR